MIRVIEVYFFNVAQRTGGTVKFNVFQKLIDLTQIFFIVLAVYSKLDTGKEHSGITQKDFEKFIKAWNTNNSASFKFNFRDVDTDGNNKISLNELAFYIGKKAAINDTTTTEFKRNALCAFDKLKEMEQEELDNKKDDKYFGYKKVDKKDSR